MNDASWGPSSPQRETPAGAAPAHHPTPPPPGDGASAAPGPGQRIRGGRNLPAAIGVGVVLGAVLIAGLFIVKAVFVGIAAVAIVVGLWELTSRLQEARGVVVARVPLAVGAVAMLVAAYLAHGVGLAVAAAFTALAVMVWRMFSPANSPDNYLRDVGTNIFSLFYVPFLAGFVVLMLTAGDGQWRVLLFLVLTVCADTGAYAVGYKLGKHKLAPAISPGKTREGLAGALGLAMIAGALFTQYLIDGGTWWQGLIIGFAAAASATLGDLGESMLKRDLGIKDMGTLLPGHGGIMDRLDSLLATAPVVWVLLVVFVGS